MSQNEMEVDKSNNDVVSIPGFVIKKNNMRGARHGPSEPQRIYSKVREMLIKRVKRNMENTHPFLRDGSATTGTKIR